METVSPKLSSVHSSPYSSPNISALLKIKVISWSQETGLPVTVRVRVTGRTFNLHKLPLFTKSGYFKRKLDESNEVELPDHFPGGADTFEMIALFIYGSSTLVDPFNVAALRCAAEFLEMTEEFSTANLCERFDMYLNQVVLQSWDDTLIVLQKCQRLLPWAEELLIVSRCVESLAFMSCMEILDPERRREKPIITLENLDSKPWSTEVKDILRQDLWIKDLIALPFAFFKRIIGSLRRQGMKEKYVSPLVLFYANKWILSSKTNMFRGNLSNENQKDECKSQISDILEEIVDLLPVGKSASKAIPVGFHFCLLSKVLEFSLKDESREKLQNLIVSQLHFAQVDDFLLPKARINTFSSSIEVDIMKSLFSTYVSSYLVQGHTPANCYIVAELWDMYLTRVATDPELSSKRLMDLIETVPISHRETHDHLYRALNHFLMAHPDISQEEKVFVCKYLNCQKLSQEVCIEAVQNELMPLRLIIQALFVQQLNTQQAFRECSDSFRHTQCSEFSGSLSSSRCANNKNQPLRESPYMERSEERRRPLGALLQKEVEMDNYDCKNEISREEFESTSFRLQTLEKEILSLKISLTDSKKRDISEGKIEPTQGDLQASVSSGLKGRTYSRKRNNNAHVTTRIGSVNFSSQRNFASKLLKIIRKLRFLGKGKAKNKGNDSSVIPEGP